MSILDVAGEYWGGIKDDFFILADKAIQYEQAKNTTPQIALADTAAVIATNPQTEPSPNTVPVSADDIRRTQIVQENAINLGDVRIDKNILYVAAAVIAGIVVAKAVL